VRVLFVEDNAVNRQVVFQMLTAAGIEMDEAENGLVGLSKIEENVYDLILMDLRMPCMDGLTTLRHLRARDDEKASLCSGVEKGPP
jgi:CheY-like chemotaxis protein